MGVALADDHAPPPQELLSSQLLAVQADLKGLEVLVESACSILHRQTSTETPLSPQHGTIVSFVERFGGTGIIIVLFTLFLKFNSLQSSHP